MGIMGFSHPVESDAASDFAWSVNRAVCKLLLQEMRNEAKSPRSTPGWFNAAIYMEAHLQEFDECLAAAAKLLASSMKYAEGGNEQLKLAVKRIGKNLKLKMKDSGYADMTLEEAKAIIEEFGD